MRAKSVLSRRDVLKAITTGIACVGTGTFLRESQEVQAATITPGCDPRVRGPFPILSTPFTEKGDIDYDVLAREARFVDWCESPGMIWPQSGDSVDLLSREEKLHGMEVLAQTMKDRHSALCLGVQGKDIEEMLVYARHAEKLNPTAIISRPPDNGKTDEDMREYWFALAKVVKRPVIIQTTGGTTYKGPAPSTKLLIELGTKFPYFGYVKEEANPVLPRMQTLIAAKPAIKSVFSAAGGYGWLHQSRIGTEGLVTERCAYADLLAKIWKAMECENRVEAARIYSQLTLMMNLRITIPGNELRGYHLYVLKKRGVFKNMISRQYGPKGVIPEKIIFNDLKLLKSDTDEIDARLEAIKPFLKQGHFE